MSFIFPSEDWLYIDDIQYGNLHSEGYSGEFRSLKFNENSIILLDKYLVPVFETGWSTKDFYLSGKHYKSITYRKPNFQGSGLRWYNANYGCLATIFFPIFLIIDNLIEWDIMGEVLTHNLEPIEKKNIL